MTQYGKVVDVISRPPDQRTDFEIAAILPYIRKRTQIFENIRTDLLKDIIRNCKFGTRQRDDIIIKQGEVGDCFYVVLSGQISIYIHNQDRGEEEERKDLESIVQFKDGKLDRAKLGNYVTSLGEGNSVGEVALIDETCIRTASIVADAKTDLVIVDKPLYDRCVKDTLAKEFEDKKQFILNNSLFSSWAPKYRKQLTMALYKAAYPYDSVLVRQGDAVEFVYFILRGQVEIQIDSSTHPTQYAKIFTAANETEAEKLTRKWDKPRPPTEVNYNNASIRKRDNLKSIRLCYLGINETVGDTEMTMDLNTYMQTAVCKEPTEVLVLEKKHYERLFVRRHPRTIDVMRQQIGVKLLTRKSLLSSKDDIPFLGYLTKVIDVRNRPPPVQEKEKEELTVSKAEKEFLNHKGPLIDLHGPGSVFHLIRVREQTKLKLRSKRERLVERPQPLRNLPTNVILASQQLVNGSRDMEGLADNPKNLEKMANAQPRSFRRIQISQEEVVPGAEDEQPGRCLFQETQRNQVQADSDGIVDSCEPSEGSPSAQDVENAEEHDAKLCYLEDRIREWLKKDNPKAGPQVTQLRRLTAQDLEQQPHPGNKVVIRRRRPVAVNNSSPRNEESRIKSFRILLTNS